MRVTTAVVELEPELVYGDAAVPVVVVAVVTVAVAVVLISLSAREPRESRKVRIGGKPESGMRELSNKERVRVPSCFTTGNVP